MIFKRFRGWNFSKTKNDVPPTILHKRIVALFLIQNEFQAFTIVFTFKFEQILSIVLVSLLLTLSKFHKLL